MPKGGKRPGAGRPPGRPNRASPDQLEQLAALARSHTETAIQTLVDIMKNEASSDAGRVSAVNSILDRGYGKAPVTVDNTSSDGTFGVQAESVIAAMEAIRAKYGKEDDA